MKKEGQILMMSDDDLSSSEGENESESIADSFASGSHRDEKSF